MMIICDGLSQDVLHTGLFSGRDSFVLYTCPASQFIDGHIQLPADGFTIPICDHFQHVGILWHCERMDIFWIEVVGIGIIKAVIDVQTWYFRKKLDGKGVFRVRIFFCCKTHVVHGACIFHLLDIHSLEGGFRPADEVIPILFLFGGPETFSYGEAAGPYHILKVADVINLLGPKVRLTAFDKGWVYAIGDGFERVGCVEAERCIDRGLNNGIALHVVQVYESRG